MSYFTKGATACALSASMLAGAGTAPTSPAASPPSARIVYSFTGNNGTSDGYAPVAALLEDGQGEFYGTTLYGGTSSNCIGGCGTVFKVNANGTETVVYSFTGGSDGALPNAGLFKGNDGKLYGTTEFGGDGAGCQSDAFVQAYGLTGCGTVFSISPAGEMKIVYAFTGVDGDGSLLFSGVVQDASGNLFGATAGGSNGAGTIFEISPDAKERVVYSFSGGLDGSGPNSVTIGRDGALYGTTISGGASGLGTVFRVALDGTEEVLHSFSGGPADGAYPGSGLLLGHNGKFYGSTLSGGSLGSGSLFEITSVGNVRIVHSFTTGAGGSAGPNGPLVQDAEGGIYGSTEFGGTAGFGSIFKLSRHNVFTTLVSLTGYPSGAGSPAAGVFLGSNGKLYGTSIAGGTYDGGTVFEVSLGRNPRSHASEDLDLRSEHSDKERTDQPDSD